MEYQILKRDSFKVLTKVKSFLNDESGDKIPGFWSKCKEDGSVKVLCENSSKDALLGLCEPEIKGEKTFRYGIGIECYNEITVPDGFELWTLPAHTWAVFQCVGPMPTAIQDMWKKIYSEFFPQSEYEPMDEIDFELYPDGDTQSNNYVCEIWIPIKKKLE